MKIDLFEFLMKCQRSELKYLICCKKLLCTNKFLCFISFIQRKHSTMNVKNWHHKASKCTKVKIATHYKF